MENFGIPFSKLHYCTDYRVDFFEKKSVSERNSAENIYRTCAIINRGYYFFSLFCTIGYYSRAVINWVRLLLMDFFSDYTKPLYILRQTACIGTKKNFLKLLLEKPGSLKTTSRNLVDSQIFSKQTEVSSIATICFSLMV